MDCAPFALPPASLSPPAPPFPFAPPPFLSFLGIFGTKLACLGQYYVCPIRVVEVAVAVVRRIAWVRVIGAGQQRWWGGPQMLVMPRLAWTPQRVGPCSLKTVNPVWKAGTCTCRASLLIIDCSRTKYSSSPARLR